MSIATGPFGSPSNLSMPSATVIPVLHYADVPAACAWLCRSFGFVERLRIGDHRVQLAVGDGAVVVAQVSGSSAASVGAGHSVMVRLRDVDSHFAQAAGAGARIVSEPTTHVYGERQYSAEDLAGRLWTFSQTVENSNPRSWGGELVVNSDA
jgi:uncharacterized glyoxalase superfamily protein PhnB